MKKIFAIAMFIMSTFMAANAQVSNKLIGTWTSTVDGGTEKITIVISANEMTIKKIEHDGEVKTKYFNKLKWNGQKNRLKAHQYKEVKMENTVENTERENDTEIYYIKWIDAKHIQLGDHPYEMDADYGTLTKIN